MQECWNKQGQLGLRNSLLLAAGTALAGTVIASLAAYAAARQRSAATRLVHLLSTLTLSVPGLVLGLAYVLAFKRSPLYGTMGILILASTVHFFATPYLMLYQAFGKLNANLEGTGQVLGIPPFRLFVDVFLPQCGETLVDMAAYFFLNAMVTISAVSFLATAQTRPLSMLVTQYSDQINPEAAAVLSFFILTVNLLARGISFLLKRRLRRVRQQRSGIE